ncbi:uncharacterized protein LOC144573363 isoform X2 [Carex rostrata]
MESGRSSLSKRGSTDPLGDLLENLKKNPIPGLFSSSSTDNSVVLDDWWLVTSNVEGESKGLAVAGHIAKKESQLPFISTQIVKRHDTYTLEAADGVTVKVEGMINQTNTLKNGFSHEMCERFTIGFPIFWKQYIDSFADTTPVPGTNPSQILEQPETCTGNILNPSLESADPIGIDDDTLGDSPGSITTKEFEPAHEGNPSSSDNNLEEAKKVVNLEEGDTTNLEKEDTTSNKSSDAPGRSRRTKVAVVNNEEEDTTNLEKEDTKSNKRSDAPRKSGRIKQQEHGSISTDGKEAEEFSTPRKDDTLSDKNLPSVGKVGRRKKAVAKVPDMSPTSVKRSGKKDHVPQSRDKTSGKGSRRANMKAHGTTDNVPVSESNIRRSRSGRAIIPTVDKGSQTVVYDQNGNFAGIATPISVSTGSTSKPSRKKRRF